MSKFICERLAKRHDRKSFDCGVTELDEYLRQRARDVNFPGIGKLLLLDALARSLQHTTDVASAVVLVDAKHEQAHAFYSRYGFTDVSDRTDRMFLPIDAVAKLLQSLA